MTREKEIGLSPNERSERLFKWANSMRKNDLTIIHKYEIGLWLFNQILNLDCIID
jgi:hypothetical protein